VPPLRERRDDIPLLARHLLARCNAASRPMEPALAEELLLHDWPLNVRGLLNVLSIAAIAAEEGAPLSLRPEVEGALRAERRLSAGAAESGDSAQRAPPGSAGDAIEAALRRSSGNVADAARSLGCSRQHVYRWLEAQGLDASRFRRASPRAG
jgi:DNA-binding NtrC family response regulator